MPNGVRIRVNSDNWEAILWKYTSLAAISVAAGWSRLAPPIQTLLILMGLDVVSGIIAAIGQGKVSSGIMLRGIFKKLGVFPLLALLHVIEKPLNIPFEFESIAAMAFIVYEAMSIIENCATAGVPIPSVIVDALAKAKIKTATPEQIHAQFEGSDELKSTVKSSTQIIPTPAGQPDIKVDKIVTLIEEKHVAPVEPPA